MYKNKIYIFSLEIPKIKILVLFKANKLYTNIENLFSIEKNI